MARPYGDITLALQAAAAAGPCTVRELAMRACVGFRAAEVTASRMVQRGQLQRLSTKRPTVLALPPTRPPEAAASGADLAAAVAAWR